MSEFMYKEIQILLKKIRPLELVGKITNITRAGLFLIDKDFKVLWINKYAIRPEWGMDRTIGGLCYQIYFDRGRPCEDCPVERMFRSGREETSLKSLRYRKRKNYVELTAMPVKDEKGRITQAFEIAIDVTEKVLLEEKIKKVQRQSLKEKEMLKAVFQGIADPLSIQDADHNILMVNDATARLFCKSREELVGKKCYEVYRNLDHRCDVCPHTETLRTKRPARLEIHNPLAGKTLDSYAYPIFDDRGQISMVVEYAHDVTEKKKLEAQLLHAQKMEAMGTLAGGVAHDFNNILQAIFGNIQLLMMDKEPDDPNLKRLEAIEQSAQRAKELVQQILLFSRKVESKRRPMNLNERIGSTENLLRRTIPKMIHIELRLEAGLSAVHADPVQMEQVLMNLAVNARDAMPEGGELLIRTENVTLDEEYCKTHLGAQPGQYVLLSVSDTGCGMDKKTLGRIFEPFFTTKEAGEGTGLGLAIVYGIVKSHGGYITCYSEPGHGSTFKVYLPAVQTEAAQEMEKPKEEEEMPGGDETLLLVDDEEGLRRLGWDLLRRFGYRVLTAADGESALELYKKMKGEISLVVLDLIMPGMGGRKCLEELLKIDPDTKVIVASGHLPNGPTKEAIEAGAKGFIRKPYDTAEMLRAVRRALEEKADERGIGKRL